MVGHIFWKNRNPCVLKQRLKFLVKITRAL